MDFPPSLDRSALLLSALHGRLPLVQWLIEEGGADIAEQTTGGRSALQLAAGNGKVCLFFFFAGDDRILIHIVY
jgi:ankyrin repeat protein